MPAPLHLNQRPPQFNSAAAAAQRLAEGLLRLQTPPPLTLPRLQSVVSALHLGRHHQLCHPLRVATHLTAFCCRHCPRVPTPTPPRRLIISTWAFRNLNIRRRNRTWPPRPALYASLAALLVSKKRNLTSLAQRTNQYLFGTPWSLVTCT